MMQELVDAAAYFNLFSRSCSDNLIYHGNNVVGLDIHEALHRFDIRTQSSDRPAGLRALNRIGEQIGTFRQRWLFTPEDYIATPNRVPPPTPLDPTRRQRFVMLDGVCTFGTDGDGFYGFGTGYTVPTTINGLPQLLALATGTVIEGFGKFTKHEEGTYVYCGTLTPGRGFTGNVMLRAMDRQQTFRAATTLPQLRATGTFEKDVTYLILRGEAVPDDPVSPNLGPDGKPIGLIVEQGLRLQQIDCAAEGPAGIRALNSVGTDVGRVTAYVVFDPSSATGTRLNPIPFTAYDEFRFFDRTGQSIGGFAADSTEGRVFNTSLAGQPAIRFGGIGHIRGGTGTFEGIEGLMTDNSVVAFAPHVSASVYILRLPDSHLRFRGSMHP